MGLLSDGGVHSEFNHLTMLLDYLASRGIRPAIHAFMDGRDTPPQSGGGFMRALVANLDRTGGHVATVTGRYYAMDRDGRWDRIEKAYNAIVCREGRSAADPIAAVEEAYRRGEGDEFIEPTVIDGSAPLVRWRRDDFFQLPRRSREADHQCADRGGPDAIHRRTRA